MRLRIIVSAPTVCPQCIRNNEYPHLFTNESGTPIALPDFMWLRCVQRRCHRARRVARRFAAVSCRSTHANGWPRARAQLPIALSNPHDRSFPIGHMARPLRARVGHVWVMCF